VCNDCLVHLQNQICRCKLNNTSSSCYIRYQAYIFLPSTCAFSGGFAGSLYVAMPDIFAALLIPFLVMERVQALDRPVWC